MQIGIVQGDQIIHLAGFGQADSTGRPATPQTPMITASITKSFTALAVMQLVEAGKVDLDAPVQRYLSWFRVADANASARITVREFVIRRVACRHSRPIEARSAARRMIRPWNVRCAPLQAIAGGAGGLDVSILQLQLSGPGHADLPRRCRVNRMSSTSSGTCWIRWTCGARLRRRRLPRAMDCLAVTGSGSGFRLLPT